MEAFENWVNRKPDDWDGQRKDVARIAWKAALEWIYTEMTSTGRQGIRYLINEELAND